MEHINSPASTVASPQVSSSAVESSAVNSKWFPLPSSNCDRSSTWKLAAPVAGSVNRIWSKLLPL
jgi:hypothetical protein